MGSTLYYYSGYDEQQEAHFLDACHLCSKPLGFNSDIFMYRGDTPFCSKDCRQEQIDVDEAKEKKSSSSSSSWKGKGSTLRNSDQRILSVASRGSVAVS